jgi:hypothetical protein
MMDEKDISIVKNWFLRLLKEQAELEPEYNRVREKRDAIHNQLIGLEQILRSANVDVQGLVKVAKPPATEVEIEPAKQETLPDAIVHTLQASGKAMHYREISAALANGGFYVPGKDPGNTVLAYMTRYKGRFAKAPEAGKGYYKLKE